MSELERSVKKFRKGLLDRDAEARMAIRRSFQVAIAGLQADLTAATNRIAELRETGPVPTWRLLQEQRIRQLLARAEIEFQQFSDRVDLELVRAQRDAINRAQADARQLIVDGFGPGPPGVGLPIHLLPVEAMKQLTATLQPDAPVRRLLDEFAGDASQAVQDELVRGMASGQSPYAIGRSITKQLGAASSVRAQRIVRTELMRSYRNASLATYQENSHLVKGWRWVCAMTTRSCPVCISLHGRVFALDVPFASHPNCRCVASPVTRSWEDLGYPGIPETGTAIPNGPDVFAAWSAEDQRRVLGPAAYAAYRDGDVDLADFVGITRSTVWGTGRRRVSLALAKERGRKAA